jgi:asparagine synthase (glutamine-hydrolysing)
MCGICGYAGVHRPEILEPMHLAMSHRGPDDFGLWTDADEGIGLAQRRLSIIDLSPAGHQPMGSADGNVWITFNGEIYDFTEHRAALEKKGYRFRSRTDTEVLIYLYQEYGIDFLQKINGMFAFALWDAKQRRLHLARDHAGIKPIYYWCAPTRDGQAIYFASEIKALLRIPELPRRLAREKLSEYLTFLWVPGEDTLLEGIRKIEPGCRLTWHDGRIETKRWFSLAYEPDYGPSEADWIRDVHDTFMRTTQRQMVADVPLGAFLSGGADSSAIVACMRKSFPDRHIKCYTAQFAPGDTARDQLVDDYPFAKTVADRLGVELHSFVLEPKLLDLLPKMIYHLDEPDADPAVLPSYLISKLARDDGTTVLLSGTGGDEVFFGYRSHQAYRQYGRFDSLPLWLTQPPLAIAQFVTEKLMGAQQSLPRRLRKFRRALGARGLARHLALVDWSSPAVRSRLWTRELATVAHQEAPPAALRRYYDEFQGTGELNRHSHVLIQTFLAAHNFLYTDKSSMAASIEVRVPFLDLELMRLCARIPEEYKLRGDTTKYVLKKAMEPYIGADILYRSKTGFGVPLRKWMAEDLRPLLDDSLSESRLRQRGLFEPAVVRALIEENEANRADHAYLLYSLLTLELWQQTFIDGAGPG